jgi:hypothetical protein
MRHWFWVHSSAVRKDLYQIHLLLTVFSPRFRRGEALHGTLKAILPPELLIIPKISGSNTVFPGDKTAAFI